MLFDGLVPGQAGFILLPYWEGGEEDAQALKGSGRAEWDVKIKTCKFLSCPPAWATPTFLPLALGLHTFLDFNRSRKLQTLNAVVVCLCY